MWHLYFDNRSRAAHRVAPPAACADAAARLSGGVQSQEGERQHAGRHAPQARTRFRFSGSQRKRRRCKSAAGAPQEGKKGFGSGFGSEQAQPDEGVKIGRGGVQAVEPLSIKGAATPRIPTLSAASKSNGPYTNRQTDLMQFNKKIGGEPDFSVAS